MKKAKVHGIAIVHAFGVSAAQNQVRESRSDSLRKTKRARFGKCAGVTIFWRSRKIGAKGPLCYKSGRAPPWRIVSLKARSTVFYFDNRLNLGMTFLSGFSVKTRQKDEWLDITREVEKIVAASGVAEGLCVVFVPHTTAAVTVNECADADVPQDLRLALGAACPERPDFRHAEGNSAAHAKATLVGPSVTLIVSGGRLVLGTWQGLWFTEFDGPRARKVHVRVLGEG
jgi:secondary thiamine-phosphate synthase enzyme